MRNQAEIGLRWRVLIPLMMAAVILLAAGCGRPRTEPAADPLPADPTGVSATASTLLVTTTLTLTGDALSQIPEAPMATAVPLVEVASSSCRIESDIDLAGYPNIEQKMGCALEPARYEAIAFNEFGLGPEFDRFMLWLPWDKGIRVLLPGGTWQLFPDTWTEDQPTFTCNPLGGEPSSPPLPRRGFGKVWCEDEHLREQLGMVGREERLCQHAATQRFEKGTMIACFEDATVRYFQLFDDHTWAVELQPS